MNSPGASISRRVALLLLVFPVNLLGNDIDADGVEDTNDACSNTPLGITVDAEGRPVADLDGDCDIDLVDYAALQINFTGLHDAALIQANMTGPLPCVAGVSDKDIQLRHIMRYENSGATTTCRLPTSEPDHLAGGCFLVEIYAVDTSEELEGISCVFFDVHMGNSGCPLVGTGIIVSDTFVGFQSGSFVGPGWADEVGGCTLDTGVGVGEWVLIATIEVVAAQDACHAGVSLVNAETESTLVGSSEPADLGLGTDSELSILCPGTIYDVWPTGGDGFIDASDRSILILCTGETAPFSDECSLVDWNCDGAIDQNDKDLFDTAWQKGCCAGGIEVSPCQFNCEDTMLEATQHNGSGVDGECDSSR